VKRNLSGIQSYPCDNTKSLFPKITFYNYFTTGWRRWTDKNDHNKLAGHETSYCYLRCTIWTYVTSAVQSTFLLSNIMMQKLTRQ
jgi:hypothetical protein